MNARCWWLNAVRAVRSACIVAALAALALESAAQGSAAWRPPAVSLSAQIAAILGPGPAALTIRNQSSIPADQLPAIRRAMEDALKSHGVTAGGADSANSIRITLSENARERLWVAEMVEGNETRVAMVELAAPATAAAKSAGVVVLRRQALVTVNEPVLAAAETPTALLLLEPRQVLLYTKPQGAWQLQQRSPTGSTRAVGRDARGALAAVDARFEAWLPGVHCTGSFADSQDAMKLECRDTDDPWAIAAPPTDAADAGNAKPAPLRAFYNAARNSFTGVVTPGAGVDLPPFLALAILPSPAGMPLLIGGVDGKVQIADGSALHAVSGTRDWGSDFALLQSGCGAGAQVVVSGSGDAAIDSLRAYELPRYEAIPASEALSVDGTVMQMSAEADGKSILAVVRHANQTYEVDRVTALCN